MEFYREYRNFTPKILDMINEDRPEGVRSYKMDEVYCIDFSKTCITYLIANVCIAKLFIVDNKIELEITYMKILSKVHHQNMDIV